MQQFGHPASVDTADAPVNESVQVAQDQTLRQEKLEPVGGHAGQRAGQAQRAVQENGGAERAAIGDGAACGALIAPSALRPRALDQPIGIRQDLFGHPRRDGLLMHAREDGVAFMACQRDEAERDAIMLEHVGALLGSLHCFVQPLAKALGLGAHDVMIQIVVFGRLGHILAHGLQRDGDNLARQCLVDRREPVQPEPADDRPQGRPLHNQCEEREARGEDADHAFDFHRDADALGDGQGQRQGNGAAQAAPQDGDAVGWLDAR